MRILSSLHRAVLGSVGFIAFAAICGSATAQPASVAPAIRQCGNLLSDRVDIECAGKKQVVLNGSGLQRVTTAPLSSEDEQPDERQAALDNLNQRIKLERRRKDNLLTLFPDETRHSAARARDLAVADIRMKAAMTQAENLRMENKRLTAGVSQRDRGALPHELRLLIDQNESAMRDVAGVLSNVRDERASMGRMYDEELVMLRKLWAVGK